VHVCARGRETSVQRRLGCVGGKEVVVAAVEIVVRDVAGGKSILRWRRDQDHE
jgi:hypothetical protein